MEQDLKEEHEKWMGLCLELAKEALQKGDPPVGSIVVNDGKMVGKGREATKSKKDITCHAEIEAIRDALKDEQLVDLSGCTLYTTHEPCLMCSYVIRHYKINLVVSGSLVPTVGGVSSPYPLLKASEITVWSAPPMLVTGVLQEACEALSRDYQLKKTKRQ